MFINDKLQKKKIDHWSSQLKTSYGEDKIIAFGQVVGGIMAHSP